jgi:hypothetical protein
MAKQLGGRRKRLPKSGRARRTPEPNPRLLEGVDQDTTNEPVSDVAVIVVHGIGNQAKGSVLRNMAQPCVAPLAALAARHGFRTEQLTDVSPLRNTQEDSPRSTTLVLTGSQSQRRILVAEAVWSRAFDRPPWWYCLYWGLRCLPAVVLLLAPDRRDETSLLDDSRDPSATAHAKSRGSAPDRKAIGLDDHLVMARWGYRALFAALVVGLPFAAALESPVLGVIIGGPLLLYLASRRSIVGHVVVAATGSRELDKIYDCVRHTIDWAGRRAKKTIVIAHSQGGYLCHQILSGGSTPMPSVDVASFVGVGSGLRPIWLLRHLAQRRVMLLCWLWFLSVAVGEAVALRVLAGFDQSVGDMTNWLIQQSAWLVTPIGVQRPPPSADFDQLEAILSPWREVERVASRFGLLEAAGAAVFLAGGWLFRRQWARVFPRGGSYGIAPVQAAGWEEFSSYHDPVGRMLLPALPSPAKEQAVAVGGHPVMDHVAYFSSTSVVPWRIAGIALGALGRQSPPVVDVVHSNIQRLAARRRALRAGIFSVVLFFALVPSISAGEPLIVAIANAGPGLLVTATLLSVAFALRESRVNGALLSQLPDAVTGSDVRSGPAPVGLRARALPTGTLLMLAACGFLAAILLADYPSPGANSGGALLLLGELALAYMLAVGAGYRPWRWPLLAGVLSCVALHLAAVPPIPHPSTVSDLEALPGLTTVFTALILTVVALISLPARGPDARGTRTVAGVVG